VTIQPHDWGSDGSSTPRSNVIGGRFHERWQERRRADVRNALREARSWAEAGLEGSVPLAVAVCGVDRALHPAFREILSRSLEDHALADHPGPWELLP
jgi:hypothetical protein